MVYSKPQLTGYAALAAIQTTGPNQKTTIGSELSSRPTQPAYEADE